MKIFKTKLDIMI